MKIAFVQKYPFPYFGIMSLSACTPREHAREIFIGDLEEDIVAQVLLYRPDILALPVISTEYVWMLETAGRIKKNIPGLISVAGCIHATSMPEMIEDENIDAVCIGEAEYSFPKFLEALTVTGELQPVDGFWIKRRGKVVKGKSPPPVLNLDSLPEEDRGLYYSKYAVLKNEILKNFIISRGCPFSCSFCCHQVYKNLYRGKGNYVRWKSPEKVIREISHVKEAYGAAAICFLDDVFIMDAEWLTIFSGLYRELIALPYFCAVAPALMTDAIARLLKESGCHTVNFGVETASEEKRFNLLNKRVTNDQIIHCARLVKKYGMKIQTTNMFGLPFETVEEAFENIKFNITLGTDFMCSNILLPFPKTHIEKVALQMRILNKDYLRSKEFRSIHLNSVFRFKDIHAIENVQKISHIALKFPSLMPLFKRLVRIKNRRFFFWLYVMSAMWRYKSERTMSWWEAMKLFWRSRKNYTCYRR